MSQKGKEGYCGKASGQALVEYALILLLFTIVVILAVHTLGESTTNEYVKVNDSLAAGGYGESK